MNCDNFARQRVVFAYTAWKTLLLAHSQIVAAGIRTSICNAIDDIERELLLDLDLLPPTVQCDVRARIAERNRNRGTMY